MKTIIFINGTPRSGKDTLANNMCTLFRSKGKSCTVMKFAKPLFEWACAIVGANYTVEDYESIKDERLFFGGKVTFREIMISLSEDFAKKLVGDSAFADILMRDIENSNDDYIIVSDTGFQKEYLSCVEHLTNLNYEVRLLTLLREGYTFDKDSRETVLDPTRGVVVNVPELKSPSARLQFAECVMLKLGL